MIRSSLSFCAAATLAIFIHQSCPTVWAAPEFRQGESGVCSLDVSASGGKIHLLLARKRENAPGAPDITHQFSVDWGETWSAPKIVNADAPPPHSLHRGSDARIVTAGSQLMAVWTSKGTDKWGSGPLATALSGDGGMTWNAGPNPSDDGRTDGHGFVAADASPNGAFHLAWLDNRGDRRGLRYAESRDGGWKWSSNVTVVPRTCECCWNSILSMEDGCAAILFRAVEPRDMALAITRDYGQNWSSPTVVGRFGWDLKACPHVGGALARTSLHGRNRLHAVVWTAQQGAAGVYCLHSDDMGHSWGSPRRMGHSRANHPHMAANSRGFIAAAWDAEGTDGITRVWMCISRSEGETWSVPTCVSNAEKNSEHPRIVGVADGFRIFWTEKSKSESAEWNSVMIDPLDERFTPSFGGLVQ